MNIQRNTINKVYNNFNLNQVKGWLKIDNDIAISGTTIEELYEDAVDYVENFLGKDVAYTLKEWVICSENLNDNISIKKVTVDEGNFIAISAITYTNQNDQEYTITDQLERLKYDSNTFTLALNNSINAKEFKILFHTGYEQGKLDKSIRKILRVLINDAYDVENSSYTLKAVQKLDVIERTLSPIRKYFFINY